MTDLALVDTTLRDGHLSLWATNMRTHTMLSAAPAIDRAGFVAAEITGGGTFKKIVRDLRENPWDRVRAVKALMPRTPLRVIQTRYPGAFQFTPQVIHELYLQCLVANGVEQIRISDPSNTEESWRHNVGLAKEVGLQVILNLVYTFSPRHTDEYYRAKAEIAATLPVDAICLKDPGGLMTPERLQTLVPTIREAVGSVPLEFHGHCNTGLGPLNAIEAVRLGIPTVHTAIPPLANGVSLPSAFNVTTNLQALGSPAPIDLDALREAATHLEEARVAGSFVTGKPLEYDIAYYEHQVPGGMMSNLKAQLAAAGMEDRISDVLAETANVRRDFGYPIMVTPYSQFVGIQAALNILAGERYKQVTDEVIEYALGIWGKEEAEAIDPEVRAKIIDRERAEELRRPDGDQPTLAAVRRALDAHSASDEELVLMYFAGSDALERTSSEPTRRWVERNAAWLQVIKELGTRTNWHEIAIEKNGYWLRMGRSPGSPVRKTLGE